MFSTNIVVPQVDETSIQQVNEVQQAIDRLQLQAEELSIEDNDGAEQARQLVKECQKCDKIIEDLRKAFKAPYAEIVKQIDAAAKQYSTPIEEIKAKINKKVNNYVAEQQRQQQLREMRFQNIVKAINATTSYDELNALEQTEAYQIVVSENGSAIAIHNDAKRKQIMAAIEFKKQQEENAAKAAALEAQKATMDAEKAALATQKIEQQKKELDLAEQQQKIDAEKAKFDALQGASKVVATEERAKGVRKQLKWEVVDEDAVPAIFKTTDSKKINEEIKKGAREITGIKIREESIIV